jgi:hypothetical protein
MLVDQQLRIRGFYELADPPALDRLVGHIGLLVNRGD